MGALTSVIALYFLMVARQVYIADPAEDRRMRVARPLGAAIALCVIGTLVIGVYPRPFVALGEKAAAALHIPSQELGKHTEAPEPLPYSQVRCARQLRPDMLPAHGTFFAHSAQT